MKLLVILACLVIGLRGAAIHADGTLNARAPITACGSNEVVKATDFDIRNYWVDGSQGSACTTVLWSDESVVSWIANWSWPSRSDSTVSSSTAHFKVLDWTHISNFESIPISWLWSYQSDKGIKANVAYNVVGFTEGAAVGNWNLQVWLGSYGPLKPRGSKFGIAHLSNVTYDVFTDESFGWKYHTFVARTPQRNFTGDLVNFFDWTVDNLGIGTDWSIFTITGGTNVYQGVGATFTSSRFSLAPKYKTTPSAPPLPSQTAAPACSAQWGQCGGQGWNGPRCCPPGNSCVYQNQYHSQCLLDPVNT